MNSGAEITTMSSHKIEMAEIAYFLYFTVMFGARAIGLFEGMLVYNISLVIGMLLFALKVALTKHTVLEYCIIGLLLLISLIVYYNTGEKGLLLYFTMMLGMKGVSVRKVFKLGTAILGIAFPLLVLLSITGLREEIIYVKERAGFGNVIRHSLGYPYPNTLFTTYIVLMVLITYVMGRQTKKNLFLTTLFMLMGTGYIYIYSCSNTGLIVGIFFLMVNLYLQLRKDLTRLEQVTVWLVYPGCLLISIVGPLVTRGKLFELFDKVLHNRWAYSLYYLTNEPVTLFGVRFKEAPDPNYMVDSSFLYSLLQIGVIPFLILTGLYLAMIYDCVKNKKRIELVIIISFCVLGLSDPFLFNLSYKNLMFLFIGEFVYRKLKMLEEKELGFLNWTIQFLPIGNREMNLSTALTQRCCKAGAEIRKRIAQNNLWYTVIYLITAALITGSLYVTLHGTYLVGRADEVPEWEYLRNIMSAGIFGAAVIVLAVVIIRIKQSNKAVA